MSSPTEKPLPLPPSKIDESKLESGLMPDPTPLPEVTFTWRNPGPLFKSARRVIIFSFIVWMIVVIVDSSYLIHPPDLTDIFPKTFAPITSPPKPKPKPKPKYECMEGAESRLLPVPANTAYYGGYCCM